MFLTLKTQRLTLDQLPSQSYVVLDEPKLTTYRIQKEDIEQFLDRMIIPTDIDKERFIKFCQVDSKCKKVGQTEKPLYANPTQMKTILNRLNILSKYSSTYSNVMLTGSNINSAPLVFYNKAYKIFKSEDGNYLCNLATAGSHYAYPIEESNSFAKDRFTQSSANTPWLNISVELVSDYSQKLYLHSQSAVSTILELIKNQPDTFVQYTNQTFAPPVVPQIQGTTIDSHRFL